MWEFLSQPAVRVILSVLAVMLVSCLGYFLLERLRDSSKKGHSASTDLLTNFEEMRLQGDISDAEFRNIRSVLGSKARTKSADVENPS
jgi:hypothetical protein